MPLCFSKIGEVLSHELEHGLVIELASPGLAWAHLRHGGGARSGVLRRVELQGPTDLMGLLVRVSHRYQS